MLDKVKELLEPHRKVDRGHTIEDTWHRLIAERIGQAEASQIPLNGVNIELEEWSAAELSEADLWHKKAEPRFEDDPIIILRHNETDYVIDGANRVNKWAKENNPDKHEVLVVT